MSRQKEKPPLTRSEVMSRVKSKNTKPELRVRKYLWSLGLRYRLHKADLPSKPDIVFTNKKVVIFVNGCFWHGHKNCKKHRIPKTRSDFWSEKIAKNALRDSQSYSALGELGWTVQVIWECETENPYIMAATLKDTITRIKV